MKAIEAIEDDTQVTPALGLGPDAVQDMTRQTTAAMDDARLRDIIGGSAKILSDAAASLYSADLEDAAKATEPHTPDDDRAAGRLNDVRLDLLSE